MSIEWTDERMPARRDKPTDWMHLANCLGIDPDIMFPGRGEGTSQAKAVCRECCVRAACLDYALTPPYEKYGVWGGSSERERRTMRRRRAA